MSLKQAAKKLFGILPDVAWNMLPVVVMPSVEKIQVAQKTKG